jgi:hypothetical protein
VLPHPCHIVPAEDGQPSAESRLPSEVGRRGNPRTVGEVGAAAGPGSRAAQLISPQVACLGSTPDGCASNSSACARLSRWILGFCRRSSRSVLDCGSPLPLSHPPLPHEIGFPPTNRLVLREAYGLRRLARAPVRIRAAKTQGRCQMPRLISYDLRVPITLGLAPWRSPLQPWPPGRELQALPKPAVAIEKSRPPPLRGWLPAEVPLPDSRSLSATKRWAAGPGVTDSVANHDRPWLHRSTS